MQRVVLALVLFLAMAVPALSADLKPEQQTAICGSRSSCKLVATDAGQGAQHEALTVVEAKFALADKPQDAPEQGCANDGGEEDGPEYDGGHEFWLIDGDAAPKRLLALCNDGYGAAGVGSDEVKIGPNQISHEQTGGSAWRWDVTKKIRLSPLQVTNELDCSFNDVGPGTAQVTEIDRLHLHARSVGYVAGQKFGDDEGVDCPDWPTGPDSTLPTGPKLAGAYAVPMPGGPGADGQGTAYPDGVALGDCALELSTDGLHGFLVFGKPAETAQAAAVRVIKETASSLLIQVYDPTAATELKSGKAKSWLGQPHIEIWTAEMENPEDNDGANGQLWSFHQFAIGLDDRTYPGVKAFSPLPKVAHWSAKDEAGRDVTVFRVSFEGEEHRPDFGLGVVYSQAENGKQARLVSNAQIVKNKPLYLPDAWTNGPEDNGIPSGTCSVGPDKVLKLSIAE
jgi:hypothetical protein